MCASWEHECTSIAELAGDAIGRLGVSCDGLHCKHSNVPKDAWHASIVQALKSANGGGGGGGVASNILATMPAAAHKATPPVLTVVHGAAR